MKTNLKSLLASLSILALCATPAFARTLKPVHAVQPEMSQALVQLEEAKHAKHPVEHLERAKHDLQDAKHNKHGERVEAIHHVNEAIAAAHKHNHKAMEAHIDAAIRDVREGKHAARK